MRCEKGNVGKKQFEMGKLLLGQTHSVETETDEDADDNRSCTYATTVIPFC